MLFNSYQFLLFFPVVTLIYYVVPKQIKQIWLLICSYFFYMCWNAKYALLMLFSTVITYICSLVIETIKNTNWPDNKKTKYKRLTVGLSFVLNLSVLGYYKYTNFLIGLLSNALGLINITLHVPKFDIILPVGISFYTFQALSYTMDVYRDEIYAEKNFLRYALFVSFFPQLVAGPIERSKNLLRQLSTSKAFSFDKARKGFLLMLWGFFLKVVLADRIAIFVDAVYGNFWDYDGCMLMIATILFAFQIYCDFYGYSVIAIGAAKILGIDLMENFNAPYLAQSVAEFWRNWHISLTSWFKDYLYIPLGGSRKGKTRKYLNKMIVFLVSGLWHGAGLSFVAWGGLNGLYQIVGEVVHPVRSKMMAKMRIQEENVLYKAACILTTFILVDFTWIFFRADSLINAIMIIEKILSVDLAGGCALFGNPILTTAGLDMANLNVMVICILVLLIADIYKHNKVYLSEKIAQLPWWIQSIIIVAAICVILIFGIWGPEYNQANFIYFQF